MNFNAPFITKTLSAFVFVGVQSSLKAFLKLVAEKCFKRGNLVKKVTDTRWGYERYHPPHVYFCLGVFYCRVYCSVWSQVFQTSAVGTMVYDSLRVISGCLAPTPPLLLVCFVLLPDVAVIPPASILRNHLVLKLVEKSYLPDGLAQCELTTAP